MAVLEQVRATILQHSLFSRGDNIVVGVSGGPDSLALLHCLRALRQELQIDLYVAHLNHQLRGDESDADAQFVAWLAQEWKLPKTIEARDVRALASSKHLSIEEAARRARYEFLIEVARQIGANAIAVAHHADDQVETVLMHFLRGAGLAGLRGMLYKTEIGAWRLEGASNLQPPPSNLYLVRPLLDVTRNQIETYCEQNDLAPHYDATNSDTTFFRNRLRHETLPYLETLNPNMRQTLVRASHALADDFDFLQRGVRSAYASVARGTESAIVFDRAAWRALHPALQRGTLRAAVHQLRGDLRNIDWTHIEDARRVALEKSAGAIATLPDGLMLIVGYDDFTIIDAAHGAPRPDLPQLTVERVEILVHGVTELPNSDWVVQTEVISKVVQPDVILSEAKNLVAHNGTLRSTQGDKPRETVDRWTMQLDFAKCRGALGLRRRHAGDRFQPAGLGGHTQTLHEFMINEKIPRAARADLPLLVVDDQIMWVCGWRADERARPTDATREFWQVSFRKKENP